MLQPMILAFNDVTLYEILLNCFIDCLKQNGSVMGIDKRDYDFKVFKSPPLLHPTGG